MIVRSEGRAADNLARVEKVADPVAGEEGGSKDTAEEKLVVAAGVGGVDVLVDQVKPTRLPTDWL